MRVFAPRRTLGYRSGNFWSGIPLEGEWIEIPDYFNQVTSGKDINDVVHAQIVDPTGFLYTKWDQVVTWRNGTYQYPQCRVASSTSRYLAIAPYHVEQQQVLVDPAKNYKGDPAKAKPAYTRTVYQRIEHGLWAELNATVTSARHGIDTQYYVRGRFSISGAAFDVPEELDRTGKAYTIQMWWALNGGGTWSREILPGFSGQEWSLLPEQYELAETFTKKTNTKNSFSSKDEACVWVLDQLERFILSVGGERWAALLPHLYDQLGEMGLSSYRSIFSGRTALCTDAPIVDHYCRRAFILDEPEVIGERLDPIMLGAPGGMNSYWRNYLTQHALLEACESLPRLSDNSIQNLVEIVGFIKALVVDHRIEIPKSLADAWLSYRYQYSTAKMDAEEAIKFVHRHMDLGTLDRMIVSYGRSSHLFDNGTEVTCRCTVEVKPKEVDQLHRIWRALDTYGLTPDFYVVWDSVPYSFMVDWFLPIGDMVGVWDANSMYFSGEYYTFSNLCYSLTYTRELDGVLVKCYTRWAGSVPSGLNSLYWLEGDSTSGKTIGKRVLDTVSIFIGR